MPSVRSAHTEFTGLPGQPRPMILSGFLLPTKMARPLRSRGRGPISGERLERGVDLLQNLGLALLAPVQSDHLLVGLDFVDIARQFFEMIE